MGARFTGRTVLITGGSRGIGRAVALRFAREGATIMIVHHADQPAAIETLHRLQQASADIGAASPWHTAYNCDLSTEDGVSAVAALIGKKHVDVLINNAGILPTERTAGAFDADDFERVLSVNLKAAARLSAAVIETWLAQNRGGCIINTTSVHETVPKPGYAAYAASKAALGMLTRTLALEHADKGIRVNAVGPGAVTTAMNDAWRNDSGKRAEIEMHIPMGFAAAPDDIAGVYTFLASDDARYVTGQTLYACGGLTLHGDFKRNWSS